jgi:hypothetical protein
MIIILLICPGSQYLHYVHINLETLLSRYFSSAINPVIINYLFTAVTNTRWPKLSTSNTLTKYGIDRRGIT